MLAQIASLSAEGGTLAFDCADAGLFEATENRVRKMLALAIGSGEPMKSCISLSELEHMLEAHGFLNTSIPRQYAADSPVEARICVRLNTFNSFWR